MKQWRWPVFLGGCGLGTITASKIHGTSWWGLYEAAVGGFLLCQAIYGKWLTEANEDAKKLCDAIDELLGWLNRREAGRKGLN